MDLPDYNQNVQFYSCCHGLLQIKHLRVKSLTKGIPETGHFLFRVVSRDWPTLFNFSTAQSLNSLNSVLFFSLFSAVLASLSFY